MEGKCAYDKRQECTVASCVLWCNALEYKSPEDALNYDVFLKGIAYVYLYKTKEMHVDEILLEDVTLTFIRERKPVKLFKTLQKEKFHIEEKYSGIYYIIKEGYIRIQIIVSRELSDDNHIWLNSLSTKVKTEQVVKFLNISQNLVSSEDVNYSDSVWEVMETVNREAVKKVRENEMTKAWAEIVQPKIDEAFDNGFNNGSMCSFKNMIKEGMSRELAQKYSGLSDELVEKALAEMKI